MDEALLGSPAWPDPVLHQGKALEHGNRVACHSGIQLVM